MTWTWKADDGPSAFFAYSGRYILKVNARTWKIMEEFMTTTGVCRSVRTSGYCSSHADGKERAQWAMTRIRMEDQRPIELPSTENSIATIGAPFALFLPTGKEHMVENEQEARELLSYAHALNAYIQGNHTGFILHRAEEGGTMNVTDRLRLSKQHAQVMSAIYAWQDRTGEKVTGGVTGTERMRKAEENRCNACFFNVQEFASSIRA